MKHATSGILLAGLLLIISPNVLADITWQWSFNSESGYFLTDGTLVESEAPNGTYALLDFCVASSDTNGVIGSMGDGVYETGTFATDEPFTFTWDGSSVTAWLQSGNNAFNWHVYSVTEGPTGNDSYFFGWTEPNVNDPTSAAHYVNTVALSVGTVTVGTSSFNFEDCRAVPKPVVPAMPVPALGRYSLAILTLMMLGMGWVGFRRFS